MADVSWRFLRRAAQFDVRRSLNLTVEGLEHVPARGPVLLASRHYHHLHDGAAIVATIPRPTRILVGLDWIEQAPVKWTMDRLCAAAGWPVVQRRRPGVESEPGDVRALLAALDQSVETLRKGEVLLVFPEGYPTIDPTWTPKTRDDEVLPFMPGVVRIASRAERIGLAVPIVPVGLEYRPGARWDLTVRFGEPYRAPVRGGEADLLVELEHDVRMLSGLPTRV